MRNTLELCSKAISTGRLSHASAFAPPDFPMGWNSGSPNWNNLMELIWVPDCKQCWTLLCTENLSMFFDSCWDFVKLLPVHCFVQKWLWVWIGFFLYFFYKLSFMCWQTSGDKQRGLLCCSAQSLQLSQTYILQGRRWKIFIGSEIQFERTFPRPRAFKLGQDPSHVWLRTLKLDRPIK